MNNTTPARANVVVLKQILNLIPRGMINRHARETGVEAKARTFSVVYSDALTNCKEKACGCGGFWVE